MLPWTLIGKLLCDVIWSFLLGTQYVPFISSLGYPVSHAPEADDSPSDLM